MCHCLSVCARVENLSTNVFVNSQVLSGLPLGILITVYIYVRLSLNYLACSVLLMIVANALVCKAFDVHLHKLLRTQHKLKVALSGYFVP